MKELKRTLSFLNDTCKKEYYKVLWIVVIVDCIEILAKAQIYYSKKREYITCCLHDNHIIVLLLAVLGMGVLYSSREFDGYMKVAAKRKEYLRGFLIYSGLLSLGILVLNRVITLILSALVIYILGIPVEFFSSVDFAKEWVIYLWGMNLGFFIGAVFYRMRKRTFWVMSFMAGYVLVRIAMGGYFLGMNMEEVHQGIWKIVEHFKGIGLLFVSVFMLGSVLLLRKAPIKTYAHDML
ncbi:hypothetical protein [Cellulosilyticum sp. I15G10I2]|uniref:hypothetical protein n=1 Tax=Cellulosilyticum sp. I15G10I2 TaxID=1892843 RepID=UPI00085BC258|nr:hypothetical protein [Cellulosilyticum sp. I15G10I2]